MQYEFLIESYSQTIDKNDFFRLDEIFILSLRSNLRNIGLLQTYIQIPFMALTNIITYKSKTLSEKNPINKLLATWRNFILYQQIANFDYVS